MARTVDSRECLGGVLIAEVVLIQSQDPHTESCLEWLDSTTPLALVGENSLLFLHDGLILYCSSS